MSNQNIKHSYSRESVRLRGWDYGSSAIYFVTICTGDRSHYFGKIQDGIMHLSEIGVVANDEWFKSPKIRPDMNLKLGKFVVMPNHIRGIVIIGKNQYNQYHGNIRRVATHCDPTPIMMPSSYANQFGPQRKNLASIIRGYKSIVTKSARRINPDFTWQSRYYDHVIRNPESEDRINRYIRNNIENWINDRFSKPYDHGL